MNASKVIAVKCFRVRQAEAQGVKLHSTAQIRPTYRSDLVGKINKYRNCAVRSCLRYSED